MGFWRSVMQIVGVRDIDVMVVRFVGFTKYQHPFNFSHIVLASLFACHGPKFCSSMSSLIGLSLSTFPIDPLLPSDVCDIPLCNEPSTRRRLMEEVFQSFSLTGTPMGTSTSWTAFAGFASLLRLYLILVHVQCTR